MGENGEDYIEGNQGSDNLFGGEGEDDVVGGSSANTGHLNDILPPGDRDAGYAPGALVESSKPFNLLDGHDVIEGNAEDDLVGGRQRVRRPLPRRRRRLARRSPGRAVGRIRRRTGRTRSRRAASWTASDLVRRDVTTKQVKESAGRSATTSSRVATARTTSTACSATTGSRATRRRTRSSATWARS